jgi:hypothetical protein
MNAVFLLILMGLGGCAGPGLVATPLDGPVPVTNAVNPEADRLRAQAYELFNDPSSWRRAARLLERSADLRSTGDPVRSDDYRLAGRLYAHTGALNASQRAFERAAMSAQQIGAVAQAAGAYLDAAHVAVRRGDGKAAGSLVERGNLLSLSPHLDAAERRAIQRRIPAGVAWSG